MLLWVQLMKRAIRNFFIFNLVFRQNIKLTKKDILLLIVAAVSGKLLFISNLYAFLLGSLIITFDN